MISKKTHIALLALFIAALTFAFNLSANAQEGLSHSDMVDLPTSSEPPPPPPSPENTRTVDILPAKSLNGVKYAHDANASTHPLVRLTPDKSEIVRLDGKAATIIVGNPAHLNVLADSQSTLVLVPRAPGASYFTVLDDQSNIIMQRHVIIASPKEKYIRIRRSCAGAASEGACQTTQVYYCPDMCHEVLINAEVEAPTAPAPMDSASGNGLNPLAGQEQLAPEGAP